LLSAQPDEIKRAIRACRRDVVNHTTIGDNSRKERERPRWAKSSDWKK